MDNEPEEPEMVQVYVDGRVELVPLESIHVPYFAREKGAIIFPTSGERETPAQTT